MTTRSVTELHNVPPEQMTPLERSALKAVGATNGAPTAREVHLTTAAAITIKPVHWMWADRLAAGTLALLGGREGIGKSTIGYQLAADVTRGRLPGRNYGTPRAVIVAATEDSWAHTIVPRLMAAEADLALVYRVDVTTATGFETGLSLPTDLVALEVAIGQVKAALILFDPLLSRLDGNLDTHKDADVRRALEPLTRIADRTGAAMLGLIHLNKSTTTDPLSMLMASRAFAAVARAVLFVMVDPEDETSRILGEPKNNLGRTDLPTLSFRIESAHVADTDEGPVYTGKVAWTGESTRTLTEMIESASEGSKVRTGTQDAADWLEVWLTAQGGTDESANVKRAGRGAGHSNASLQRGRESLGLEVTAEGFPRKTYWTLPGTAPVVAPVGESTTGTTGTTGVQ